MYLLDTNAISELRKVSTGNSKANIGFANWANSVNPELFYINQIVVLELRKGALLKSRKDPIQGRTYQKWLDFLLSTMGERILSVTDEICWKCAEVHIPNPKGEFDSLIAATALVHNLTVVTRNVHDFVGIDGLKVINPFVNYS